MEVACLLKYRRNDVFSWRSAAKKAWRRLARGRRKLVGRLGRRIRWASLQVRKGVLRGASASGYQNLVGCENYQPVLRYDMSSYAKNFDDGDWRQEEEEYYRSRSFATRFGRAVDE